MRLFFISLTLSCLASCQPRKEAPLRIAIAANMQFAMANLIETFEQQTGIPCEAVVSSSGKLAAQIREGAPFELFASADMQYPETLYQSGLTTRPPAVYAYGKLVLWTLREDLELTPGSLRSPDIRHIAVANPKTAPYGSAAVTALRRLGIYEQVESKLVYGESIAQVNQFVLSKTADIGFTAQSVVLSPEFEGRGRWLELSETLCPPVAQGAVLIRRREGVRKEAVLFYDFLLSEQGRRLLEGEAMK
jgi:molybdate transport system substrate-binding protein